MQVENTYFCPKCGSILNIRSEGGNVIMVCPRCGYTKKTMGNEVRFYKKSITLVKPLERKEIDVVELSPTTPLYSDKIVCPKCNSRGAYYWRKQKSSAESSDIIETTYKCRSCGYTWSELE